MTTPGELVQVIAVGEPGPQVVAIGTDSTPTPVYVPGPTVGSSAGVEIIQEMIDDTVEVHVSAPAPHPAYDDLPSFTLLFENGLV